MSLSEILNNEKGFFLSNVGGKNGWFPALLFTETAVVMVLCFSLLYICTKGGNLIPYTFLDGMEKYNKVFPDFRQNTKIWTSY